MEAFQTDSIEQRLSSNVDVPNKAWRACGNIQPTSPTLNQSYGATKRQGCVDERETRQTRVSRASSCKKMLKSKNDTRILMRRKSSRKLQIVGEVQSIYIFYCYCAVTTMATIESSSGHMHNTKMATNSLPLLHLYGHTFKSIKR